MKPRARPPLNDAYFRRMSAIEFAVKYDDGVGSGLNEADIVLVGVSRTSKTPLSIYLGYLGYKTANVPLVKGIEPPRRAVHDRPVEDRRPDDRRDAALRDSRRAHPLDARRPEVRDLVEIYDELEYATQVHRRLGCPVLEVSELSIEEISHRIIQLVERRKAEARLKPKPPVPLWRWAHVVHGARGRARPLLRALHAVLVRPSRARLAGGVPRRDGAAVPGRFPARMANRYVYDFEEPIAGGRDLLGGKGIGLAEMTQIGVPVPAGFTITTDACRASMAPAASCRTGSRTRSTSTSGGSRSGRASASARATTRCSSRCARAPPSRCRG